MAASRAVARCHVYSRVSHRMAVKGDSLNRQAEDCWMYYDRVLAPQGVVRGEEIRDEAVSAYRKPLFSRPGGVKLLSICNPGDHVLFLRMDRAFRNMKDFSATISIWTARAIFPHFINQNIDLSTATGRMIASQIATFCQWESDMKSERLREMNEYKRRHNGGMVPGTRRRFYTLQSNQTFKVTPNSRSLYDDFLYALRLVDAGLTYEAVSRKVEAYRLSKVGKEFDEKALRRYWTPTRVFESVHQLPEIRQHLMVIYGDTPELHIDIPMRRSNDGRYEVRRKRQLMKKIEADVRRQYAALEGVKPGELNGNK